MALPHAAPGTPIDVRPLEGALPGSASSALFKASDLEVIRLVLRRGEGLPLHAVPGEVVVHCLEGVLQVDAVGSEATLRPGQLLFLAGGTPHAVRAVDDASGLLTIALGR